ncbi:MAG: glycosyltransferase [Steroidobacteraceae bacterium]
MNASSDFSVSVVTVTYGDRWALLSRVLAHLESHPKIGRVVVIDNGARVPVAPLVQRALFQKAIVVRNPRNLGSAAGFKLGIETVLTYDPMWIWLLDDDNLPDPTTLDSMHRSAAGLDPAERGLTAFTAFRPEHHVAVAAGEDVRRCFPPHSSFCGFHVADIPHKVWRRMRRPRGAARREIPARVSLPYAPYGGLFFHRDLLKNIGTPNQELVLYADDTEFTSRIVQSGGRLWLLTGAPILELEPSWSTKERARTSFEAWLTGSSDFRVFYRARNRAYFDSRVWSRNKAIYRLNRLVYLLTLGLFALRHRRLERYGLFRRAIARGEEGCLGLEDEFPLP